MNISRAVVRGSFAESRVTANGLMLVACCYQGPGWHLGLGCCLGLCLSL